MNAKYIYKIALELSDMPYKSILINGAWGIGKSYEINRAFAGNEDVYYISLFGLKDSKQLYHEVLMKLFASNPKSEIILDKGNKMLTALATFFGKENMLNIITEDEIVITKLNSLSDDKKNIILIFDDMERIGSDFNLEEFFGIVERFRSFKNVKIIIVANLNETCVINMDLYEKYNEKIVDKIYNIDELSSNIEWSKLHIEKEFVKGLL
jgi:Cdc6-like AAA superfamily ATPase